MVFLNSGRWDLTGRERCGVLQARHLAQRSQPRAVGHAQPVRPAGPDAVQLHLATSAGGVASGAAWPSTALSAGPRPRRIATASLPHSPACSRPRPTCIYSTTAGAYFTSQLNIGGSPNTATHTNEMALAKGDTIDFVVGWGNGNYGSDSTALTATIESAAGRKFDLAADFPRDKNPAGPWSCGWLAPGDKPDPATFALYTESRYKPRPRFGSLANPGSAEWEDVVTDHHNYPRVPHTAEHHPVAAHSRRRPAAAVPVRVWHRQRGGLVARDAALRATRQDGGRGRAVLS